MPEAKTTDIDVRVVDAYKLQCIAEAQEGIIFQHSLNASPSSLNVLIHITLMFERISLYCLHHLILRHPPPPIMLNPTSHNVFRPKLRLLIIHNLEQNFVVLASGMHKFYVQVWQTYNMYFFTISLLNLFYFCSSDGCPSSGVKA